MSSSKSATKVSVCPFCGEEILPKVIKCKHCGSLVSKEKPIKVHIIGGQDSHKNVEKYLNEWIKKEHKTVDIHDIKIGYAIDPSSVFKASQYFTVMIIYS